MKRALGTLGTNNFALESKLCPQTAPHTMLLKWLFTLLAIIWLYQALRQLFLPTRPYPPYSPPPAPPPPARSEGEINIERKKRGDTEGDYIDYEEVR